MKAFFRRPQTVFLRRALFQVHLWVGLAAGLYIFVVCATGALLVFRIDLQRAAHPALFTPSAPGTVVHPAAVLDSLRTAYPADRLSGIDTPSTERPTYLAYVGRGNEFLTVLVDPSTASVLGELPDHSVVRTIQDLHFELLGGRTGRFINGVGAVLLLVMCLTGPVIWWRGSAAWWRGFLVDVRRGPKRINWDAHSAIGIWTVAVIAVWAVTGIYFVFPSSFRGAVNAISPITVVKAPTSSPPSITSPSTTPLSTNHHPPSMSWRELIDRAQQQAPAQFVARIVLPYDGRAAFQVLFSPRQPTPAGSALTPIYLDQYTGAVLAAPPASGRTLGDVVMAWAAPLHVGGFGGRPVKWVWLLLGLAPPALFVTGVAMWWIRNVRGVRDVRSVRDVPIVRGVRDVPVVRDVPGVRNDPNDPNDPNV